MARRDRDKAAARRRAAVQRAAANTGAAPGKDVGRARREELARIVPSAGRVTVVVDGQPRSVDVVATALAFGRGVLGLQGSGNEDARERAGAIHRALCEPVPHVLPSGATLAEVLEMELSDLPAGEHDGAVTLAQRLTDLGQQHDEGTLDLYARVAPPGLGRHPKADEVDMVCAAVVPEELAQDPGQPRLVVVTEDGWLELWPEAAFEAHRRGVLTGSPAEAVGEGLHAWLGGPHARRIAAEGPDALPALFGGRDVRAAFDAASRSAGSDHPRIAGPVLLDLLAPRSA